MASAILFSSSWPRAEVAHDMMPPKSKPNLAEHCFFNQGGKSSTRGQMFKYIGEVKGDQVYNK